MVEWSYSEQKYWLVGFCPLHSAENVLDQFRDRFIKEVDSEAVVGGLLHKDIIDEGDERDITSAKNPTRQNEKLHLCLRRKCTLDALITVCDIMTAVGGNPNMLALGETMKRRLETGVCMHACVCACIDNLYFSATLNPVTFDLVCIHLCTTVCCDGFDGALL